MSVIIVNMVQYMGMTRDEVNKWGEDEDDKYRRVEDSVWLQWLSGMVIDNSDDNYDDDRDW